MIMNCTSILKLYDNKIFNDLKTHLENMQQDNKNIIFNIKRDITALESNREKIEKLVIEGTFDKSTYLRNRDEIEQGIIAKKIQVEDYENGLLDVSGLIEYGKRFVHNLSSLWLNLETAQKRGFQDILFPEGLSLENGEFRTATISPILSVTKAQSEALINCQATLAGERGFEPALSLR